MRIYIAGPMTGHPDFNYATFRNAAARLREAGHDVVNPAELHGNDFDRPFDYYLRRDLAALLTCEAIALLPDWPASRGATLERRVALGLDMPIFEYVAGELVAA